MQTSQSETITKNSLIKDKRIQRVFYASLGSMGLLLLLIFFEAASTVLLLANLGKAPPTLVQTESGALTAGVMPNEFRSDEVITKFTEDVFASMFTWDGKLLPTRPIEYTTPRPDPGKTIKVGKKNIKVPTRVFEASFAFEPLFRQAYLRQLDELIPNGILKGNQNASITFLTREILPPEVVEQGKYQQVIIAEIIVFQDGGTRIVDYLPFRKKITYKTVKAPEFGEFATQEALLISNIRQAGLEITNVEEYTPGE